jgi:hypothetical protein
MGGRRRRRKTMDNFEKLTDDKIERLLSLHLDKGEYELDQKNGSSITDWNCPSFPRILEGLHSGFTDEEERQAPMLPDFQKAVYAAWLTGGVSFWMLARSVAESERFPFAPAMRKLLDSSREGQIALHSNITSALVKAIAKTRELAESRLRLQNLVLGWESTTHRFVIDLHRPAFTGDGVFAAEDIEPYHQSEKFANGLTVRLEEVVTKVLEVAVSQPVSADAPSSLHVQLMGETGKSRETEVTLQNSGNFAGGNAEIGEFNNTIRNLGRDCLVVVSPQPFPDLEE